MRVDAAGFDPRLAWPLGAFLAVLFCLPLVLLAGLSLQTPAGIGLGQYAKFLGDGFSMGVLGGTMRLGAEVTLACLVLGFPLAWLHARSSPGVRSLLMLVVLLPLLTSVVVRTFAWIVILGRQGILNNALIDLGLIDSPLALLFTHNGVVLALAQVQMPLMVLPLITSLGKLDPNLADASAALGAGTWRTFFRVILPLTLPGIIAGSMLTFGAAVTAFITQSLVGGGRLVYMPLYIYQQALTLQNWPFAAAVSILFMTAVMLFVMLFNRLGQMSRGYIHA